jgi:aryl-alcohol dehydrogenase-like predicted oxidoreductase
MEYTTLGRTGLEVSVAGLGCGGPSRIGQGTGKSEKESIALIRAALDLGINFVDTATAYGTEAIVGRALSGIARDSVVVSTKNHAWRDGGTAVVDGLDASLAALKLGHVDLFHVHGVTPDGYAGVRDDVYPALLRERDKGKIRHIGITEMATEDADHAMLVRALDDGLWDVVMVAFHMMHQNGLASVFPKTQAHEVGTLIMFAVRRLFSTPERLRDELKRLAAAGEIPAWAAGESAPLGFLVHDGGAESTVDAAYRFVRHEPACDVTLTGTGDLEHLKHNVASLLRPPLPAGDVARIKELFGNLNGIGLDRR